MRPPLFRSIRSRLAGGHIVALALVLGVFAIVTYAFMAQLTRAHRDQVLADAVRGFSHTYRAELDHGVSPAEAAREAAEEFRFSGLRILAYTRGHELLAVSDSTAVRPGLGISEFEVPDDSPLHALLEAADDAGPSFGWIPSATDRLRAYADEVHFDGEPLTLLALQLDRREEDVLSDFRRALALAVPLALLLAGVGGYLLARRSLAPVMAMSDRAERVGAESLGERLPVANPNDELGRLAGVFNGLLDRLETAFTRQRAFIADASHELRTPVSILRTEADVALSKPRTGEEYREALEVMREETVRLSRIVNDLFTLARVDSGQVRPQRERFYLEETISDSVRSVRALAEDRGVTLAFTPTAEAPMVGDEGLVRHAILNLLDNALKHTPSGGAVSVELTCVDAQHRISVRDTGEGIPPDAAPHVFDRFYRAERARPRPASTLTGAGLGLAIARWCVEVHGGALELTSPGPGGTVFTILLPAPAERPEVQPA